jgi:hypothetical protein
VRENAAGSLYGLSGFGFNPTPGRNAVRCFFNVAQALIYKGNLIFIRRDLLVIGCNIIPQFFNQQNFFR